MTFYWQNVYLLNCLCFKVLMHHLKRKEKEIKGKRKKKKEERRGEGREREESRKERISLQPEMIIRAVDRCHGTKYAVLSDLMPDLLANLTTKLKLQKL